MDTVWGFLSVVASCGTVIYCLRAIMPVILAQRSIPQTVAAPPSARTPEPIPVDLIKMAEMESEGWARESAIKKLHELYESTGDWNVVRGVFHPYGDGKDIS